MITTAALALAALPAISGIQWPSGEAKVFSDACYERDSGDVAGHIVTILRRRDGWDIKFSWSEGVISAPVRASSVKFEPSSGHLTFIVRVVERPEATGGIATFDGQLLGGALVGEVRDYWEQKASTVNLNRNRSKHPDEPKNICR